ncbi:hypothetical protein ACI01nite_22760 [Acetobacter cibinongensis]|uniref:Uncharacterized protein n=1 Tax=Acetobacter cibinongensis TaxID=146475 RepID=A0A0D6N7I7_9PROT|nr:hypothetical protein [Acetobacter cibinongensis]GAN61456.1 hypothetical protein Abci_025_001 [Acetobacter cibinongensis]GBQ14190.1 hypothetical protein AA0482_0827 [Acetobacter cibinongensis NRIC 0482]GEL59674.1 hypothetical protein ACI01nite_22760 [Acetobacter cibinongensis]
MELTFVKCSGKYDGLTIVRHDGTTDSIACPKQRIIPHEMVHYAVESVLSNRGFLSLIREGQSAAFTTGGEDSSEAIERMVETFQAELWGERASAADLISTYEHACEARGHSIATVSADDVEAIRDRLSELTLQWDSLPQNGALTVRF